MKVLIDLDERTLKSVQDLAKREHRIRKHMIEYIVQSYFKESVQD